MDAAERWALGRMQHPVRGFLHGAAAVLSVVGGVALWMRVDGAPDRRAALLIFTLSLIALYTTSSLYHSVPWRGPWKDRLQRLDHAMIYVLVAGSYTPAVWIALDGQLRWLSLAVVWSIALVGIAQKAFFPRVRHWFSVSLQLVQGWLAVFLLTPLAQRLPVDALWLGLLGGILYTLGAVAFVTRRPRLWPRVFSYHEVFHCLVVAGTSTHWAMTYLYVAPL